MIIIMLFGVQARMYFVVSSFSVPPSCCICSLTFSVPQFFFRFSFDLRQLFVIFIVIHVP